MGPTCLGVRVQDKGREEVTMEIGELRPEEKFWKSNMMMLKGGGKGIVHVG